MHIYFLKQIKIDASIRRFGVILTHYQGFNELMFLYNDYNKQVKRKSSSKNIYRNRVRLYA